MEAKFYEPRFKDGKVVALADVAVADGVIVKGFRVIRGDKGLFAAVPSRPYTVEGQTRYFNQVVFADSDLRLRFLNELLEAFARWQRSAESEKESATSSSG